MKKILLLLSLVTLYVNCTGQQLYQGIYTEKIILTDSHNGYPKQDSCFDYVWSFWSNPVCVTGMNLYIKIDSIIGPPNSVRIWNQNHYDYIFTNDTFKTSNQVNRDKYFQFLNNATLYISLVEIGTPLIVGEKYFCNFTKYSNSYADDPCVLGHFDIMSIDNVMNCEVLDSTLNNIQNIDAMPISFLYPNPAIDNITIIYSGNNSKTEINIYNSIGEKIQSTTMTGIQINIDIRNLSSGFYIVEIIKENYITQKKFIKK